MSETLLFLRTHKPCSARFIVVFGAMNGHRAASLLDSIFGAANETHRATRTVNPPFSFLSVQTISYVFLIIVGCYVLVLLLRSLRALAETLSEIVHALVRTACGIGGRVVGIFRKRPPQAASAAGTTPKKRVYLSMPEGTKLICAHCARDLMVLPLSPIEPALPLGSRARKDPVGHRASAPPEAGTDSGSA